jgi:hypothetical protein
LHSARLCRKVAATKELAASIATGLQKMDEAKRDIGLMKARLPHRLSQCGTGSAALTQCLPL